MIMADSWWLWLIHVDVWQKQYYKAIILQLKINKS